MLGQVVNAATSMFLPYFTPVILILLAAAVADRLRILIFDAFMVTDTAKRRS